MHDKHGSVARFWILGSLNISVTGRSRSDHCGGCTAENVTIRADCLQMWRKSWRQTTAPKSDWHQRNPSFCLAVSGTALESIGSCGFCAGVSAVPVAAARDVSVPELPRQREPALPARQGRQRDALAVRQCSCTTHCRTAIIRRVDGSHQNRNRNAFERFVADLRRCWRRCPWSRHTLHVEIFRPPARAILPSVSATVVPQNFWCCVAHRQVRQTDYYYYYYCCAPTGTAN